MLPTAYLCAQTDFPALKKEWNECATPQRLPTLTHEWTSAAIAALEPEDLPFILVTRDRTGKLTGAAPFVRRNGATHLTLLGNDAVPEPAGCLFNDVATLKLLLGRARRLGFPLKLNRVPVELLSPNDLRERAGGGLLLKTSSEGGSPRLPLSGSFADFESALSAQRRSDLRRAQRRAASLGQVEYEISTLAGESARAALERFFDLERRSWKARARTTIAHDRRATRFFYALTEHLPQLTVGWISIGGRTAAGTLALEYGDAVWILKTAYDEELRTCSPGVLLMHTLVQRAFDAGLSSFEFLGYEERWLELWTRGVRNYYTAHLYTYSPRGAAALWDDCFSALRRRLRGGNSVPLEA